MRIGFLFLFLFVFAPAFSEEKEGDNQVSESFFVKEAVEEDGDLSFFENYSWFFQKKLTKNKIAVIPSIRVSKPFGVITGLRLFVYSSNKQGYYVGTSFSNEVLTPFVQWDLTYIDTYKLPLKIDFFIAYNNFSEIFYGQGMDTKESDIQNIYAHRFYWNTEIKYSFQSKFFSSLISEVLLRKERPDLQDDKVYFPREVIFQLKGKIGYDSRDSWRDAENGQYHQLSFGCIPSLNAQSSFCIGEVDLRYYISFLDRYFIALRSFAGSSLISELSYSVDYTLGGGEVLRGFSENRFRGDKVYFVQSEVRTPLPVWGKYLSGVVFAELGEVAQFEEHFKGAEGLKWDVGVGLRIGMPPDYKMKLRIDFGFAVLDSEKKVNLIVDFFQAF